MPVNTHRMNPVVVPIARESERMRNAYRQERRISERQELIEQAMTLESELSRERFWKLLGFTLSAALFVILCAVLFTAHTHGVKV